MIAPDGRIGIDDPIAEAPRIEDAAHRPFGFWMATALVVGAMIGSGIFVLPAQLAPLGMTGLVAWLVSIAGAGALAWVMTALAAAYPAETGLVAIGARALGPLIGTLLGWSYWAAIWSANAIIAITAIRYLAVFMPSLAASPPAIAAAAVAAIWLLAMLNLAGARAAGRFQVATTLLKLLPLAAVAAILLQLYLTGNARSAMAGSQFVPADLPAGLALTFFALVGFETASVAAERVQDPRRTIPRATLLGLGIAGLVYVIVCMGIIAVLPATIVGKASAPVALFVETFWGRGAGLVIAAFAVIATVGALNSWVLMQGEVPLGMARAGLLPGWFARTNRHDVPVPALIVSCLLASLLIASNATQSAAGLLGFMLRLATASILWLYAGACVAAIRLRIARPVALIGLVFAAITIVGAGLAAAGLSIVLMLTAIPFYLARAPRSAESPAAG